MTYFEETKALLENSDFFYIITTNMDGNYAYVNNHYATEFSYIKEQFVGQPYEVTMHPDDRNVCVEVAAKCFENPDRLFPATIRKHDGKGGYIITQWEYKAMFDEDHHPAGILCIGYNITKYINEQQQLQHAQEEIIKNAIIIENINFQQSHLIRAPLSNIMGLAALLDKTVTNDSDIRAICKMILESSNQLDEVIQSIVNTANS